MFRKFLRSKIHRATVTQADLHYEGSLTIPPELLEASKILPHEAVDIWNVTRGTRLETYAIEGEPGSSDICANGAAAHLIHPGDVVIIASFAFYDSVGGNVEIEKPYVVFVDEKNQLTQIGTEVAGPLTRKSEPSPSDTCC
jgi:aspartate 1-decarboxylase